MTMHVADIDFVDLYRPAFPDEESVAKFVSRVEADKGYTPAKTALHQAARMVWLAARMGEVAKGRPALQILFYIIAAEAVAKMIKPTDEGSKAYVRWFFEDICSDQHRDHLGRAFSERRAAKAGGVRKEVFLSCREAVDLLYDLRCDVVHRGFYFNWTMTEAIPQMEDPDVYVAVVNERRNRLIWTQISTDELRQIVLEGAILGCRRLLPPDSGCV